MTPMCGYEPTVNWPPQIDALNQDNFGNSQRRSSPQPTKHRTNLSKGLSLPVMIRTLALLATFAAPLLAQSIEPAAAREDFDLLWKSIREAHGGLNRHVAASDLDRRVASYRARLDKPMENMAFAALLQESVSQLRDGHMRMEPDSATQAAFATAKLIPLRFVLEEGRLVVAYNDAPPDSTIRPGMSIVSINGRPVDDIVRQLLTVS